MANRQEGQENMVLGFIDLEKAYDTVSKEMTMVTFRWMGVLKVDGCHRGGGEDG